MATTLRLNDLCVNSVRGLAVDMVQAANSGHPGLPLGAAAIASAIWGYHSRYNPANPEWFNRDRFILSAGHGCALQYALLHLTGYDLSLEECKRFRQWGSRTPGHPENGITPGVEVATGPLGHGLGMAVGMAIAERHLAAVFNRPEHEVVDHFTYVICSDGDLMEGVAQEACSLAGHLGLGKLIVLYDDNHITIDGRTEDTFTEDTEAKFQALGWHTLRCDGHDLAAVSECLNQAKSHLDQPSLVLCRTTIGFGSPNRAGTSKVHGAPLGPEELLLTKQNLGLPTEPFAIPAEALAEWRKAVARGQELESEWRQKLEAYRADFPTEAKALEQAMAGQWPEGWDESLPSFDKADATRVSGYEVLNALAPRLPGLIGGCADLAESVRAHIHSFGTFSKNNPAGRNVMFGVREHGMGAIVNGITRHGGLRGMGGTFLIFSDFCRPALRLAALMHCPSLFVFSHDSVGVGEDGPTHQPVEQTMSLRLIPNFNVMRPCDPNETAACYKAALELAHTPSAILLSRQKLPLLSPADTRRHPAARGGYVLQEASTSPRLVIVATGSEVQHAVEAAKQLEAEGVPTRVVSLPSWFLFEQQPESYRREVLPLGVPTVSVEAGVTTGWCKYADAHVGIDTFGASAPGDTVMRQLGITAEKVAEVARQLIS